MKGLIQQFVLFRKGVKTQPISEGREYAKRKEKQNTVVLGLGKEELSV